MSERDPSFVDPEDSGPTPRGGSLGSTPLEGLEIEVRLGGDWVRGRVLRSRREGGSCQVLVAYSPAHGSDTGREDWFSIGDVRAVHIGD